MANSSTSQDSTQPQQYISAKQIRTIQRNIESILMLDDLNSWQYWFAVAQAHEWIAYRVKSATAAERHASYAAHFYQSAAEAKATHDPANHRVYKLRKVVR